MLVTVALVICAASLLTALLIWRRRHFAYFENLGIPGPKPNILWGNLREYHSTDSYRVIGKWCDQYGDVFGFYNGDVPFVVLRDVKFLEDVFVRNFQNFVDRGFTMMPDQMHPVLKKSIMHVGGASWKSIRMSIGYGFSANKLKQMMAHLEENANNFVKYLGEYADTGEEVHVLHKFEELAMDYVARGSFGIDEQSTSSFGRLMKPMYWLSQIFGDYTFASLGEQTAKVIQQRKNDPALRKPDILQNLLDAEYVEAEESTDFIDFKAANAGAKARSLTTEEIITSAAVLFVAWVSIRFETTATALSYISYCLAKYPDVQERLRQEVVGVVSNQGTLDYDTVMRKLKYLGQVVDETLRLYPAGLTFVTRKAKDDFEYNGVNFKAGTCFMAAVYQLHTDSRYFPNPLEFNPDRFSPENEAKLKKAAYIPFGAGPRSCVGTRLGLLQLRYTVARIVQNFRLTLGPSQNGTLEIGQYATVSTPARGPWIILHSLNKKLTIS
ncbi:hypothetical protein MTO96_024126 [Rhipicephalus appendiculatus]